MEDVLLDRLGSKRPAHHLYFAFRAIMLELTIASTVLWAYTGWNGTVEQLFTGRYGEGTHWSTFQGFGFFFYLLAVNMQLGGLNSVQELGKCIREDIHSILYGNKFQKGYKKIQESYDHYVVDNMRGIAFSFLVATLGLAVFENLWVPFYDYFQFGSLLWPIYSLNTPSWIPWLASLLDRNMMVLAATFLAAPSIFYLGWTGTKGNLRRKYSIKWRFDRFWVMVILPYAIFLWLFWISGRFPHSVIGPSQLTVADVIHDKLSSNFTLQANWVFPQQLFFPQTSYTFYPASSYLKSYLGADIYGFYVNDAFIHLLNLATKYMTMLTVCYPALLKVKVNEA